MEYFLALLGIVNLVALAILIGLGRKILKELRAKAIKLRDAVQEAFA